MIPRGKLDIPLAKLFNGIGFCIRDFLEIKKDEIVFTDKQLPCLSVRTGFALTLKALNFEPDAEILVTDINIADMFTIISENKLTAVPLFLNKKTLGISKAQLESAITSKTKALLITHLFGAIMDADEIIVLAKKHRLIVIEDCAQAFNGTYVGHPNSDVVMFSFGLIKTNTALTGAILQFNNEELFHKVELLNNELPRQKTGLYFKKIINGILINMITNKIPYTIMYKWSRLVNKDLDQLLAGFTKGFPGADLMKNISYRPCIPNLRLLKDRFINYSISEIQERKKLAKQILDLTDQEMNIGANNSQHTHWVIPIQAKNSTLLIETLRENGFDASAKASSLVKFSSDWRLKTEDELELDQLVYLPKYLKMKPKEINLLNSLIIKINA